jgi:hypothetical protein
LANRYHIHLVITEMEDDPDVLTGSEEDVAAIMAEDSGVEFDTMEEAIGAAQAMLDLYIEDEFEEEEEDKK